MHADQRTFKRLMDNFLSLSILQAVNYIVPLITFPYLVRVLGIEGFGLFSFVMAVINYGVIITDYGFDLSATKHISTHSNNPLKINEIFSSVLIIKTMMAVLFFLFVVLLTVTVDKFSENALLYIYAFGLVMGQVLFPVWFFQGIEKMRYITILNAVAKIIFMLAIFAFVKEQSDLYLVFVFNSIGAMIAGILALQIAKNKFNVLFSWQSREKLLFYLKDAWYIFTSRIAVQLYQSMNVIILGFFASNTLVGYYSIVEKIIRAVGSIMISLTRALYPYLNKVYEESLALFYTRNSQLAVFIFVIMLPVALLVYLYTPEILGLVMGMTPPNLVVTLLHIYAPVLAIYLYGNQFTNMLVILNEKKLLNDIVVTAGVLNILIAPVVIYYYSVLGLIWLNIAIAIFIYVTKGYFIFYKFRKRDLLLH